MKEKHLLIKHIGEKKKKEIFFSWLWRHSSAVHHEQVSHSLWGARQDKRIKVRVDTFENGKGEEFRVAAWLSSGQITLRLKVVWECITQADTSKLITVTKSECGTKSSCSIIHSKTNVVTWLATSYEVQRKNNTAGGVIVGGGRKAWLGTFNQEIR